MMVLSTVGDAIPQLADLTPNPPSSLSVNLGGQNFTHCCLKALNTSLTIRNGNLSYATPSFVAPDVSIPALSTAIHNAAFPCGASYIGDAAGAPAVAVPYAWCSAQCPGWEMSHPGVMAQWVGPLVQFIVPSLAFCTNVPRTRKLAIPDRVFGAHPRSLAGLATYWARLLGALLIVTVDTVVWLATCFAFAGLMLLSAVYEYALDRKVLEFLAPVKGEPPCVGMRTRAHLLLAVVVGNVRMKTLERRGSGASGRADSAVSDLEGDIPVSKHVMVHNSVWKQVMAMVDEHEASGIDGRQQGVGVVPLPTKLKSLLNSQASFGSTVGAPILFFVGGFVYTVLDIDDSLGDNDTAHSLAFGMWWMVIPYLAIISCAMLASNSPSTLEAIVYDGGNESDPDNYELSFWAQHIKRAKAHKHLAFIIRKLEGYSLIETVSEGRFQTVKLWKRGLSKRQWVQEAISEYALSTSTSLPSPSTTTPSPTAQSNTIPPNHLRKSLTLNPQDCFYVLVSTLLLLLLPCALAFIISYTTPTAGLSCRSLTYLVYAATQVCAMALWTWAARLRIRQGGYGRGRRLCWWGQVFVGVFAVFAAVGGTFMQLLGVYRSCACMVPVTYWTWGNPQDTQIVLSDNTAEAIDAALKWWTAVGSTAVGAVGVVCALAWWHQRRLRKVFRDEADKLAWNPAVKDI
ncbi:hypothetical protein F5B20DRAFT_548556 [Whalleya microplaca]|nr:hypothetical protein F5B20DRAFT_548556 [Whalleya microplaca]